MHVCIGIISSGLEVSYAYKRREIKLGKVTMLVYIYYTILYYTTNVHIVCILHRILYWYVVVYKFKVYYYFVIICYFTYILLLYRE